MTNLVNLTDALPNNVLKRFGGFDRNTTRHRFNIVRHHYPILGDYDYVVLGVIKVINGAVYVH